MKRRFEKRRIAREVRKKTALVKRCRGRHDRMVSRWRLVRSSDALVDFYFWKRMATNSAFNKSVTRMLTHALAGEAAERATAI